MDASGGPVCIGSWTGHAQAGWRKSGEALLLGDLELHDAAVMNIAQFPRSQMKCRDVECIHDDAAEIGALDGPAVHYFFNPFSRAVFADVLNILVASYRDHPRRLYLILIDPVAEDLAERSGIFMPLSLPPVSRVRVELLSPYKIAVYRSLV